MSKSQVSTSNQGRNRKERDQESDSSEDTNTVQENHQLEQAMNEMEDFDDINETGDQESRPEIKSNASGPASFDARKAANIRKRKTDFLNSNKEYVKQIKEKNGSARKAAKDMSFSQGDSQSASAKYKVSDKGGAASSSSRSRSSSEDESGMSG